MLSKGGSQEIIVQFERLQAEMAAADLRESTLKEENVRLTGELDIAKKKENAAKNLL